MFYQKLCQTTFLDLIDLNNWTKKLNFIRYRNKFSPYFIKNWVFIIKRCEITCSVTPNVRASSSCVWHESWSNNASNSSSSYTFGVPLRSLSSMSNSPFLNFWNHSRQFLSLEAASPYVMLLTDVQPYDSDVSHLSISTKTYWWCQLLSNGGNLFVHLINSQ